MHALNVLIGVPTLNGADRLHRCLGSIADSTDFDRFRNVKVVVCDDCSTESESAAIEHVVRENRHLIQRAGLSLIRNDARSGIATSWNRLVRHADADICALLNDDVEVVTHWLQALAYSLDRNRHTGMVGLNTYVSVSKGQVEHGPAATLRIEPHAYRPRIDYQEAKLLGGGDLLCSYGSAFAFRRSAFDEIGGFDERYFCFYEEVDFGVSLRMRGYSNYMLSYPIGYHLGGATNSEPANLDAKAHMDRSRALFNEKWSVQGLGELRARLVRREEPVLHEWNTQIGNWG